MSNLDLNDYNIRTDLAIEALEMATENLAASLEGVASNITEEDGIKITKVHVQNEIGAQRIGKVIGQ